MKVARSYLAVVHDRCLKCDLTGQFTECYDKINLYIRSKAKELDLWEILGGIVDPLSTSLLLTMAAWTQKLQYQYIGAFLKFSKVTLPDSDVPASPAPVAPAKHGAHVDGVRANAHG